MASDDSPLLELPTEIRGMIWKNLVVPPTGRLLVDSSYNNDQLGFQLIPLSPNNHYRDFDTFQKLDKIDLSILQICRLFREEILPILFIHNEFFFQDTSDEDSDDGQFHTTLVVAFFQWVHYTGTQHALKISYEYDFDGYQLDKLLAYNNFNSRIRSAVHEGIIRLASFKVVIITRSYEFELILGQRRGEPNVEYMLEGFDVDYEQSGNVYVDQLTLLRQLAEVLNQLPDCHKQLDIVIEDKLTVISKTEPLEMVKELHAAFGGDLHINEKLCYRNGEEVLRPFENGGMLGKAWLDHGDIGWIWS